MNSSRQQYSTEKVKLRKARLTRCIFWALGTAKLRSNGKLRLQYQNSHF